MKSALVSNLISRTSKDKNFWTSLLYLFKNINIPVLKKVCSCIQFVFIAFHFPLTHHCEESGFFSITSVLDLGPPKTFSLQREQSLASWLLLRGKVPQPPIILVDSAELALFYWLLRGDLKLDTIFFMFLFSELSSTDAHKDRFFTNRWQCKFFFLGGRRVSVFKNNIALALVILWSACKGAWKSVIHMCSHVNC